MTDDIIEVNDPYLVQLNITGACPLRCAFCYLRDYREQYLTLDEVKTLWENLRLYHKELGISYIVNLTGGDLFYHPDWKGIMGFLYREKSVKSINLLLNSFWNPINAQQVLKFRRKISGIQFNLDTVRREDLYACERHGIEAIVKIALGKNTCKSDLEKAIRLSNEFNNLKVGVDVIIDAEKSSYELKISEILRKALFIKNLFGKKFISTDPLIDSESVCPVPFAGLAVYPDGSVKLCSRFPRVSTNFTVRSFDLLEYIRTYYEIHLRALVSRGCPLVKSKL